MVTAMTEKSNYFAFPSCYQTLQRARLRDCKFGLLLTLLAFLVSDSLAAVSPETILPMHERRENAVNQSKNLTDPELDVRVLMDGRPASDYDMHLGPYWYKNGTSLEVGGRRTVWEGSFVGYELISDGMKRIRHGSPKPPNKGVLVEVDDIPVAAFDLFEDLLRDPRGALRDEPRVVPVVEKRDKYVNGVAGDGDSWKTIGFLKVEFYEAAQSLTFRPTGDLRYEASMQKMKDYAEDQARQLERLQREMERKAREEEVAMERLQREQEEEIQRRVRDEIAKEQQRLSQEKQKADERDMREKSEAKAKAKAKEKAASEKREREKSSEQAARSAREEKEARDKELKDLKQKQERLRKHEYPVEQSQDEKDNLRAGRQGVTGFQFTVVFDDSSQSLGMSFDLDAATGVVVEEIASGSQAFKAGIEVGDKIVAVCGESIVDMTVKKGIKKIINCDWPRKIRFQVADPLEREDDSGSNDGSDGNDAQQPGIDAGSQKSGTSFVLHVTSPYAFHGSYDLPSSSWSGLDEIPCGTTEGLLSIRLADGGGGGQLKDGTLCKYDMRSKEEGASFGRGEVAIAKRGVCGMVDKAIHAAHGGASSVIVVNNAIEPLREIPVGPVSTNYVTQKGLSVFSLGMSIGDALVELLLSSEISEVKAYVGCFKSSNELLPPVAEAIDRNDDNAGGRMHVVGGAVETLPADGYPFAWARFGPTPSAAGGAFLPVHEDEKVAGDKNYPVRIIAGRPKHGCKAEEYEVKVGGSVAVVLRGGGCSFGDKALAAMKVGALGLVVVDDDNNDNASDRQPQRVMATEEQSEEISIPTIMASHSLWRDLFDASDREGGKSPTYFAKIVTE